MDFADHLIMKAKEADEIAIQKANTDLVASLDGYIDASVRAIVVAVLEELSVPFLNTEGRFNVVKVFELKELVKTIKSREMK